MIWLRLFAALILPASMALALDIAAPAVHEGHLTINTTDALQAQPVELSGKWNFAPGRWLASAELGAATGQLAAVPGGLPSSTTTGMSTYWLHLAVDKAIPESSMLLFRHICGAADVYFYRDGSDPALLLKAGRAASTAVAERIAGNNLYANLPPLMPGAYTLLIHQSNFNLREGGLCGTVSWGLSSTQMHTRMVDTVKNTVVATMLLSLALGSLMLGSQNGERAAPWLALLSVACAVLIGFNTGLLGNLLPPESVWRGSLDYTGIFLATIWLPPSLLMLFRYTFSIALPRWATLINLTIPALLSLGVLASFATFAQHPQVVSLVWCAQIIAAIAVLISACRRGRQYAWLGLAASCVFLAATLYDIHRFFSWGTIEMISPYAGAILAAIHGGIYTLKFGASYQLAARLSAHLQEEVDLRTRELREKNHSLEQTQIALQHANENLRELSVTDGLTRVYNRMYFEQQFEKEWRRCARQALPLSILMIDADHFKQLNDSAGHLVGDLCLQAIAQEMLRHFKRSGEVVARYGGEEFIVLLPDTNQSKALAAAEGLRTGIERLSVTDSDEKSYRVTISLGVSTTIPSLDQRPEQLIATADAALYEAKDAGRNRVHSIPIIASRAAMQQQKLHL